MTSLSCCQWRRQNVQYGGMDISDARKLRGLEGENARLKKLLAEAMLDITMLKDLNAKKW